MNVVSYCIFGEEDRYWGGLRAIIRAHHNLCAGWEMRVHHDEAVHGPKGDLLRRYAAHGLVRLVDCGKNEQVCRSMLWRLKPIWDEAVEYVFCRDMDSLPLPKERRATKAFIRTPCFAHSISDHPQHTAHFMGGTCGFYGSRFRAATGFGSWESLVDKGQNLQIASGGPDQILMANVVYPLVHEWTCYHWFSGGFEDHRLNHQWLFRGVDDIHLAVNPVIEAEGDKLAACVGSPSFDVAKSAEFYDTHGDPEVAARIRDAEQDSRHYV
jgi:hypothetical protein